MSLQATSLGECTRALQTKGQSRINAAEFSVAELETAAQAARELRAMLFLYNLKGRSSADLARLLAAGGRQLIIDDVQLL